MKPFEKYRIFDYSVTQTQIEDFAEFAVASLSDGRSTRSGCRMVVVANTHVLTEGKLNPSFDRLLKQSDFILPDGMPLIWIGRLKGRDLKRRVYGPELMNHFLDRSQGTGVSHYFYGGRPADLLRMIAEIQKRFPKLKIAGHESPPFRPLTADEDAAAVRRINASGADVVWVGLGCPKQEFWMLEHRSGLQAGMMFGIGQAFDLIAGTTRHAPRWMQESGLEWLYRLCTRPGRLWKRYLVLAPLFVILFVWDEFRRIQHGARR